MIIQIKGIKDEDTVNYCKTSMFIAWPHCTFKCDQENGCQYCQNMPLTRYPDISIGTEVLVSRYLNNPLSHAIVMGGLEPFDSWEQLVGLIAHFRSRTNDDIVIYTGYEEHEKLRQTDALKAFPNIIIKWGRFRPNQAPHFDKVLGVKLASDNQYAIRIS